MELKFILEAILFSGAKGAEPEGTARTARRRGRTRRGGEAVQENQGELMSSPRWSNCKRDHQAAGRSYRLTCVAGAWQFVSQPEFAPWIIALVGVKARPSRLSQPALETLAIIAYRQPLTRAEIEQVRGVAVDGVMQTLLERGLVEQTGRAEVVGRPMTYGTTSLFLEYFGLRSLEDLPAADELRRIPVTRPEALLTATGLATAPPETLAANAAKGNAPLFQKTRWRRESAPAADTPPAQTNADEHP